MDKLYTNSSYGSIWVISKWNIGIQLTTAHPSPINSLKYVENSAILASGNDDETIIVRLAT